MANSGQEDTDGDKKVAWKQYPQTGAPKRMVLLRVEASRSIPNPKYGEEQLWKENYWKKVGWVFKQARGKMTRPM